MFTENFCRYEFKFPVSAGVMDAMLKELEPFVEKDAYANAHGFYCLSSIYFDNDIDQCFHETMNGERYRQKIRLCVYRSAGNMNRASGVDAVKDEPLGDDEPAFFEIKSKINGLVMKRRAKMRLADAMAFTAFTQKQLAEGTEPRTVMAAENTEALKQFGAMRRILERACFAIVNLDTGSGKLEDLEAVQEFINQERIREYEDQKAEGEGETT